MWIYYLFPTLIFYNLEEADDPRVCSRSSYFSRPYLVNIHSEPALISEATAKPKPFSSVHSEIGPGWVMQHLTTSLFVFQILLIFQKKKWMLICHMSNYLSKIIPMYIHISKLNKLNRTTNQVNFLEVIFFKCSNFSRRFTRFINISATAPGESSWMQWPTLGSTFKKQNTKLSRVIKKPGKNQPIAYLQLKRTSHLTHLKY